MGRVRFGKEGVAVKVGAQDGEGSGCIFTVRHINEIALSGNDWRSGTSTDEGLGSPQFVACQRVKGVDDAAVGIGIVSQSA